MTNPKCKLVVVPEGCVVVPEEPSDEIIQGFWGDITCGEDERVVAAAAWKTAIKAALQLDTPPVLRWERSSLMLYTRQLLYVFKTTNGSWAYFLGGIVGGYVDTKQEARRAAEKALGFPDGLVVEVVE